MPATESVTAVGSSVEYDEAPYIERSTTGTGAGGSRRDAGHRSLRGPAKYHGQHGLLVAVARTNRIRGIVHSYDPKGDYDVRRSARALWGCS